MWLVSLCWFIQQYLILFFGRFLLWLGIECIRAKGRKHNPAETAHGTVRKAYVRP